MDIRIDHAQLVSFSPGIIIVDKLKVANDINGDLPDLFDGDPVILPIPEEAPAEIPRIQMNSKDGRYNLSISKSRLDFIFRYRRDERERLFPIPGLFEKFLTLFQYFKEIIHTQITRFAIVTNWIIELEKTPAAELLLSKYIRSETPIITPRELELHYLSRESISGLQVNKWTHIKSARIISEPVQNKFVFLHLDINTLPEIAYNFDCESLRKFLDQSSKVINETIEIHLKNMGG